MHGKLVCFRQLLVLNVLLVSLWLSGCDGGSSSTPLGNSSDLTLSLSPVKTLTLNWTAVAGASHYNLYERLDPDSDAQLLNTTEIPASQRQFQQPIALHTRLNARYQLDACQGKECKLVADAGFDDIDQLNAAIGYVKASDPFSNPPTFRFVGNFGQTLALSDDGRTLAIGALNGAKSELTDAGLVYVFHRTEAGQWQEAVVLGAHNADNGDAFSGFGANNSEVFTSLSLSGDGNTLAVGAPDEDSENDDPENDALNGAGAVYIFQRNEGGWETTPAYLKLDFTGVYDEFGVSLSLNGDGTVLAVGAPGDRSGATTIDGDADNDDKPFSGAAYLFTYDEATKLWTQSVYFKASNSDKDDGFGNAVSLSDDGRTLAVGAHAEDSSDASDPTKDDLSSAGAVYLFHQQFNSDWDEITYLKASQPGLGDRFGFAVSLSGDGQSLAVGAVGEGSGSASNQNDDSQPSAGAVYLFRPEAGSNDNWRQRAYLKASTIGAGDQFGNAVALSDDGRTLVVGANLEDGVGQGLGANADELAENAGAAYLFQLPAGATDIADGLSSRYLKASNTSAGDNFGFAVALSGDGDTLVVGARGEDSDTPGINADEPNDEMPNAGAVYLY